MKKVLTFSFILLNLVLLYSCKNRSETSVLKEWIGKDVKYPKTIYYTTFAKDTLLNKRYMANKYKILVYVDSLGCINCKLKLEQWNDFIEEAQRIDSSIEFLFVFDVKDVEHLSQTLKKRNFIYPVCVDLGGTFNKLNNFPSDIAFQTFLLDNNKVIAIGNPIHNFKVKELFLDIIGNKEDYIKAELLKTEIVISKKEIDLGGFDWRRKQRKGITLRNTGQQLLAVDNIGTSCGCILVEYSKKPVYPEGTLDITVSYKAEYPEYFSKTLMAYCNVKNSPIILRTTGNAKQ